VVPEEKPFAGTGGAVASRIMLLTIRGKEGIGGYLLSNKNPEV